MKKAQANMASRTSVSDPGSGAADQSVIDMAEFGKGIAARKRALQLPDLPRNAGAQRTPSKQALLKAIKDAGGEW